MHSPLYHTAPLNEDFRIWPQVPVLARGQGLGREGREIWGEKGVAGEEEGAGGKTRVYFFHTGLTTFLRNSMLPSCSHLLTRTNLILNLHAEPKAGGGGGGYFAMALRSQLEDRLQLN